MTTEQSVLLALLSKLFMTMGKHGKKAAKRKAEPEKEDLDRFAGSSEEEVEEESNHDEESDLEQPSPKAREEETGLVVTQNDDASANDKDSEPEMDQQDMVEQDDEEIEFASGMANAMSKILGATKSKPTGSSVILSKITTPLQRMAMEEKRRDKEMREKRRANRERNLTALHIPLSVATSINNLSDGAPSSVGKELEQERTHRRIATRGVVALFNAIAQHQKKQEIQESTSAKSKEEVKKISKHGFLDMIKMTAAKKSKGEEQQEQDASQPASTAESSGPDKKWNALQDDYMLNSKLKDWDKDSSESDEEENENEDWSDEESSPAQNQQSKKRRIGAS